MRVSVRSKHQNERCGVSNLSLSSYPLRLTPVETFHYKVRSLEEQKWRRLWCRGRSLPLAPSPSELDASYRISSGPLLADSSLDPWPPTPPLLPALSGRFRSKETTPWVLSFFLVSFSFPFADCVLRSPPWRAIEACRMGNVLVFSKIVLFFLTQGFLRLSNLARLFFL